MLLGLGRAAVMGYLCAQQAAARAPSNHLKSISLPSPLLLQRWVLQGQGGAASKASPCVWSDEDLKSSSPAPALELITGPQV